MALVAVGLAGVIRCSCLAACGAARRDQRTQGAYPGRTGGPWLCRTLVLPGFHAVVPSGFRTRVQPHR